VILLCEYSANLALADGSFGNSSKPNAHNSVLIGQSGIEFDYLALYLFLLKLHN
jgi:hypothetical protein